MAYHSLVVYKDQPVLKVEKINEILEPI